MARAWRRMGWRHLGVAALIKIARDAINPLGGIYFRPAEVPHWDPLAGLLIGGWIVCGLLIVYVVLMADEAFDAGESPVRVYGSAVVALVLLVPTVDRLYPYLFFPATPAAYAGQDGGAAQMVWWALAVMYEAGFGLAIYAYWRVTQRSMRRAQAAETERVRDEQRVQTARLLALQSRVEPQLLFDALARVGELHDGEPRRADVLLADLIALLRSMQPVASTDHSTVEREFALVRAWSSVMRNAGHRSAQIRLSMGPGSARAGLAPMLLLPLLRQVLTGGPSSELGWVLSADVARRRLRITLMAEAGSVGSADAFARAELTSLKDRVDQLFGRSARLTVVARPPALTLDMPDMQEELDDHRVDR